MTTIPPPASSEVARRRMEATRRRDTPAEVALRSALHKQGLRFRVDVAPLPGGRRRADVVFRRARVAVFVDGCFWHGCPQHGTSPKQNAEWWRAKLAANRARDADTNRELAEAGWLVLRFWEHEDPNVAVVAIVESVTARRPIPARR
jgi:DNA mismatch endonuclease, patch repair protein